MDTSHIEKYISLQEELKILKIYLKAEGLSCRKSKDYKHIHQAIFRLAKNMSPAYLKVAESYHPKNTSKNNSSTNIVKNTSPSVSYEQKLAEKIESKSQKNSPNVIEKIKSKVIEEEIFIPGTITEIPKKRPGFSNLNFISQ